MDETEKADLQEDIAENKFLHDFLLFLRELHKRPLGLTKTGNLKRAEIYYLGEHFLIDIYYRDEKGRILIPVLTEDQAPFLVRIRTLAHAMGLIYKRKDKLLLSKKGKAFLNNQSTLRQFEQTILYYFTGYNWGYLHLSLYKLAQFLQENQQYLWRYFVMHKDREIDFQTFLQGVCVYFGLKYTGECYYSVRWAFERVLVQDLALYGLMVAKTERVRWDEKVVSFELTALGAHIFETALAQTTEKNRHDLSLATEQKRLN